MGAQLIITQEMRRNYSLIVGEIYQESQLVPVTAQYKYHKDGNQATESYTVWLSETDVITLISYLKGAFKL